MARWRRTLRRAAPYLALLALWLLFELPVAVRTTGIRLGALRPTGEFLVLVTAYAFLCGRPNERIWKRVWLACVVAFVVIRVDTTVSFLITRSQPLFYDQLFLLRHLFVLIGDLWSARLFFYLVCVALAIAGTIVLSRVLGRTARPLFEPSHRRSLLVVLVACWSALLLGSFVDPAPVVLWMSPALYDNARESYRTYRTVKKGIFESPYKGYASIRLSRRPNVTFIFIESYGRVIADSSDLSPSWRRHLQDMQARLGADGWSMASAFSTAPVSGGRSWLAVGSIFMGTRIEHESVFRQMVSNTQHLPTVVSFFADHGYDTIALEPSDRVRSGVEEVNYYHVSRPIRFDDVHYTGPKIGWGLVPDQYSLGFAEANVLARSARPRFFSFHMVTSHVPWKAAPPIVDDWRSLNQAEGRPIKNAHDEVRSFSRRLDDLKWRLRTYGREEMQRWKTYSNLGDTYRARYLETVEYDLSVIERHLLQEHSDELVIVMGDHQPPAVTPEGDNYDVPVHVFARDPALLAEFLDHGFASGLVIDSRAKPVIEHSGFYSLLVRDLLRVQPSRTNLPPYLPRGVPLAG